MIAGIGVPDYFSLHPHGFEMSQNPFGALEIPAGSFQCRIHIVRDSTRAVVRIDSRNDNDLLTLAQQILKQFQHPFGDDTFAHCGFKMIQNN